MTPSASEVATAASTALPPLRRMSSPARAAGALSATTISCAAVAANAWRAGAAANAQIRMNAMKTCARRRGVALRKLLFVGIPM
ncbi:hypothetical protein IMX07_15495 [bacterium]|nr:hypothetical protein [bacterium]